MFNRNFISRQYNYKLNVEFNYYINKNLLIYGYNNTLLSHINLDRKKIYKCLSSFVDEDICEFSNKIVTYIKKELEPITKPTVIYSNNNFHNLYLKNKYKNIIEDNLNMCNKLWNNVNKIIKIENRYEI